MQTQTRVVGMNVAGRSLGTDRASRSAGQKQNAAEIFAAKEKLAFTSTFPDIAGIHIPSSWT